MELFNIQATPNKKNPHTWNTAMAAKGGRKRPAAEQPKIHQDDVDGIVFQSPREVKNKVTDFAKFVDSLATENEEIGRAHV